MPWRRRQQRAASARAEPWLPLRRGHIARSRSTGRSAIPASLLDLTRALLALRRDHAALRDGRCTVLRADDARCWCSSAAFAGERAVTARSTCRDRQPRGRRPPAARAASFVVNGASRGDALAAVRRVMIEADLHDMFTADRSAGLMRSRFPPRRRTVRARSAASPDRRRMAVAVTLDGEGRIGYAVSRARQAVLGRRKPARLPVHRCAADARPQASA